MMLRIEDYIREVPDHPEPGIGFKDITPILASPEAFRFAVDWYAGMIDSIGADAVLALDARGFLFAAPVCYKLGIPLVLVRKAGKLPPPVAAVSYELEYGDPEVMEMRSDADAIGLIRGKRVIIVDDLLATGGTARAAADLASDAGGNVVALVALVELDFLHGRSHVLDGYPDCEVICRAVY